ncbi:hypothetical protein [Herbidospora mongoliensis]|uniref:hypothetical protein n=1 Tax=Herbidospora mongoliensis TaxID=688067 RepID=UPI0012F88124|nr:hypothetical protein [Herbidospora mongoliensis]
MTEEPYEIYGAVQSVMNSRAPVVQVAGNNTAPINILRRPKLRTVRIIEGDRNAARFPLWVETNSAIRAAEIMRQSGLAVIQGPSGTGKRTSGIHGLEVGLGPSSCEKLFEIAADWDEEEAPDQDILPDPVPGYGYLIDITSRPVKKTAADCLTSWADELRQVGAGVIITGTRTDWSGDSRYCVMAESPDVIEVARRHLVAENDGEGHARWLWPSDEDGHGIDIFANLITPRMSPADAVDAVMRFRRIELSRINDAYELYSNLADQQVREQGFSRLNEIRDEVLQWPDFLEQKLTGAGVRGRDRLMLLSAAFLENEPVELCLRAAAEFYKNDSINPRRFREGKSPRRRMEDMGVTISEVDTVTFAAKPGLAASVIRMDWHHWPDERVATVDWINRISARNGVASGCLQGIGRRLLEISKKPADSPFFEVLSAWIGACSETDDRIPVIADLVNKAAEVEELRREVHRLLLVWAKGDSVPHRLVAARVCNLRYGIRWPRIGLVRIRHLLSRDDAAASVAAKAMITYALISDENKTRVISTVRSWLEKHPTQASTSRAFLSLVHSAEPPGVIDSLLRLVSGDVKIHDFLVSGWATALSQPEVHRQAYTTLRTWASGVQAGWLDRDVTYGLLSEIRDAHTPIDALSHFLYGMPEEDDQALINARVALANLPVCDHGHRAYVRPPLSHDMSGDLHANKIEE